MYGFAGVVILTYGLYLVVFYCFSWGQTFLYKMIIGVNNHSPASTLSLTIYFDWYFGC